MKKILSILLVLLTFSSACIFAETSQDPFDSLAQKLLKDFKDEGSTVAVKIFNSELSGNEKKTISKSVQFALSCTDTVEIVADIDDADYICTGNIEADGPNYIVSAKITDNYDGTVVAKARQKVAKSYYETPVETKTQTVVIENEIEPEDVLGAVIIGSMIGGVFHVLTTPSPRPAPARPSRPSRPSYPARPSRP